jgi:uncharacterized protein YegP (UPF0339 family)
MTAPTTPLVFVDLYQSRPRKLFGRAQTWRWKALNGNNFRVLAASSEAYTNRSDAVDAIEQLFGATSNVYLRQTEHGNQLLRLAAVEQ